MFRVPYTKFLTDSYQIPTRKILKHYGGIGKGLLKRFKPVYKFDEMFEEINGL